MSERDARRKILLLQGTLHRIEIMQARQNFQQAASRNVLTEQVPGLLKSLLANNRASLLTTVLPLLFGRGRWRRFARRALLAGGGIATAWAVLRRLRKGGDDDAASQA